MIGTLLLYIEYLSYLNHLRYNLLQLHVEESRICLGQIREIRDDHQVHCISHQLL